MAVRSAAKRRVRRWLARSMTMGAADSHKDTIGTKICRSTIFTAWAETNVDLIIKFARIF